MNTIELQFLNIIIMHSIILILLHSPNRVKVHGVTYHPLELVMYGFKDDDLPMFGRIDKIMVISGTCVFLITKFKTLGINNHLLCYAVKNCHQSNLILLSHLVHLEPLSPHHMIGDNNVYIALQSHVVRSV